MLERSTMSRLERMLTRFGISLRNFEESSLIGDREDYDPIPSQDGTTIMFRVGIIDGNVGNLDRFTSTLSSRQFRIC